MDGPQMPATPTEMEAEEYSFQRREPRRCRSSVVFLACLVVLLQLIVVDATIGASNRISFGGKNPARFAARSIPRGGALFATAEADSDEEEDEEKTIEDIREHPEYGKLQAYRMKQQVLLQLRATFLSEALAKRGLPIPSLQDVSTPEGKTPPQKVDWDCAMSTEEDPKHCLISYEPEPGSKLVVPMELASTDKWITLAALNRLRRDDPSKVEPMWNDKYAVLNSWFSPNSKYSLLQHVGPKGVLLSTLLDGNRLPAFVGLLVLLVTIQLLPIIEAIMNRLLVSGFVWERWPSWHRYVRIGLPFKLLIVQTAFGQLSKAFSALVVFIKDKLVDLECQILEETIPLTVGVEDGPYENIEKDDDVSSDVDSEDDFDDSSDEEEY